MLAVFIDTNIFFNNWYLRSANFAVLANYLSNERGILLLSEVVRQEVEAKFKSESTTLQKSLAQDLRRTEDFQQRPERQEPPALDINFDFAKVVNDRFDNVELVNIEEISNRDLVSRAISVRRPFRDGEKGYRDSVIWLSLLQHLRKASVSERRLIFINANAHDFFDKTTNPIELHPHLLEDLSEYSADLKIVLFKSLKDFIDQEVDLALHSVKHDDFEEENGNEMEELASRAAERYLQDMPLNEMQSFLEAADIPKHLVREIRSFSVEDFEGIEDPEVISLTGLKDGSLYIGYRFNLLTVRYTVTVDLDVYLSRKEEFDEYFLNMTLEDRSASLELFRRCDFEASLAYRQDLTEFTSVSIDDASMRRREKYRSRPRTTAF